MTSPPSLHQLSGLSPLEFSLVGWDPPGYGGSRPPGRDFTDFFQRDAELAVTTMHKLGFQRSGTHLKRKL